MNLILYYAENWTWINCDFNHIQKGLHEGIILNIYDKNILWTYILFLMSVLIML